MFISAFARRGVALLAALAFCVVGFAQTNDLIRRTVGTATLLSAVTTTGAGSSVAGAAQTKTYQAFGTTSAGSGSATIVVQCSVDGSNWDTLGTITLTLATTTSSNSFTSIDSCRYVRGNVTALSGTNATVTLLIGG